MIKIPYEQVIAKITEGSELSKSEIEEKIEDKLKSLSGLISKEGAAHIIANELGVKLFDKVTGKLNVNQILAGMRDVETVGKVTAAYPPREFESKGRTGKVGSFIIGDETGTIRITCWGDQCDKMAVLKPGDIAKIQSGYVRENRDQLEVHLNDRSKLVVNPPGVTIASVAAPVSQEVTRKSIVDLAENDRAEVLGTIVQAFEPKFYEACPECGKRVKQEGETYTCPTHSQVTPDYAYVLNLFLDDGTENIRCVFFREQVETLVGMTKQQVQDMKDNQEAYDKLKNDLLGNIIKISGRITKNQMFDRLEIVANTVDPKPDPEAEIAKLEK